MMHITTIHRARRADPSTRSGYGYGFTWDCLCGAEGRTVWDAGARWGRRHRVYDGDVLSPVKERTALEAACDHERNARRGPNRGRPLGEPVTELLG